MWGPKRNSWRLVFAFLPRSRTSPPTFFNVTWKMSAPGVWRTMNTPRRQDLFKDLRMREPDTETMRIQIRGADLAHLPFAGKLKWLIELPTAWIWFLTWSPEMSPEHFVDRSIWPVPTSLSSAPAGPSSMGCMASIPFSMAASPAARSTFSLAPPASMPSVPSSSPAAPAASMPSFGLPPPTGTPPSSSTLPTTTSKAASLAPSPLFSQPFEWHACFSLVRSSAFE